MPPPPVPAGAESGAVDPARHHGALDDLVREVVAAQEESAIGLVSDGQLRGLPIPRRAPGVRVVRAWTLPSTVEAWRFAAACSASQVKQTLTGPYTLAARLADSPAQEDGLADEFADLLRAEIVALAAAGCPLVEIDEPLAVRIGDDDGERRRFTRAHGRLAGGLDAPHLALALTGGNVDTAGAATFLDAPYRSYVVDLVAGPDNWRFVAQVPGERGIVCAALSPRPGSDDGPELLVWAAQYAASLRGRGIDRVGLANAPDLSALGWDLAVAKLRRLGSAARIAGLPAEDRVASLDPRAVGSKSAAFGRHVPTGRKDPVDRG